MNLEQLKQARPDLHAVIMRTVEICADESARIASRMVACAFGLGLVAGAVVGAIVANVVAL